MKKYAIMLLMIYSLHSVFGCEYDLSHEFDSSAVYLKQPCTDLNCKNYGFYTNAVIHFVSMPYLTMIPTKLFEVASSKQGEIKKLITKKHERCFFVDSNRYSGAHERYFLVAKQDRKLRYFLLTNGNFGNKTIMIMGKMIKDKDKMYIDNGMCFEGEYVKKLYLIAKKEAKESDKRKFIIITKEFFKKKNNEKKQRN